MLKQMFVDGMSRAAASVSVVTTDGDAGREGITVSAMTSVSIDPGAPALLVCMHHLGQAAQAVTKNSVFCVNVLGDDQSHIADLFAGRLKDQIVDKFAGEGWQTLVTGAPVISGAVVSFDCRLRESVRCGSHWIFIGDVVDIAFGDHKRPLIYANRAYQSLSSDSGPRHNTAAA